MMNSNGFSKQSKFLFIQLYRVTSYHTTLTLFWCFLHLSCCYPILWLVSEKHSFLRLCNSRLGVTFLIFQTRYTCSPIYLILMHILIVIGLQLSNISNLNYCHYCLLQLPLVDNDYKSSGIRITNLYNAYFFLLFLQFFSVCNHL